MQSKLSSWLLDPLTIFIHVYPLSCFLVDKLSPFLVLREKSVIKSRIIVNPSLLSNDIGDQFSLSLKNILYLSTRTAVKVLTLNNERGLLELMERRW